MAEIALENDLVTSDHPANNGKAFTAALVTAVAAAPDRTRACTRRRCKRQPSSLLPAPKFTATSGAGTCGLGRCDNDTTSKWQGAVAVLVQDIANAVKHSLKATCSSDSAGTPRCPPDTQH